MDHFVSRLDVTKLRLKQQGLGVELLGNGGLGLRWERLASFEPLCRDPARFRPKRENLLRGVHHFFRACQSVGGSLNPALNLVGYSSEVFARLSQSFRACLGLLINQAAGIFPQPMIEPPEAYPHSH